MSAAFSSPAVFASMPKLPGKFDDLFKSTTSLVKDDFVSENKAAFQLKTKQKTNLDGATAEITVDVMKGDKGVTSVPAKLTFKFPKPFAFLPGLSIDKFELDSGSKIALDFSAGKDLHGIDGLKSEVKGKVDSQEWSSHITYTGIADTSVKVEHTKKAGQAIGIDGLKAEALRVVGPAVVGAKVDATSQCPDVGVCMEFGDITAAVLATKKFSAGTVYGHYKVSNDVNVAVQLPSNLEWVVGATYKHGDVVSTKFKLDHQLQVSAAFKKDLAKGTTLFGGCGYNLNNQEFSTGFKVNIE